MNTYPVLPTEWGEPETLFPIIEDRAANGEPRTRVLADRPRVIWPLVHPQMTSTEAAAFTAFVAANSAAPFYYAHPSAPSTVYTVLLTKVTLPYLVKGLRYKAKITLIEQ